MSTSWEYIPKLESANNSTVALVVLAMTSISASNTAGDLRVSLAQLREPRSQ